MKKRGVSMLLCTAMVTALLAGCSAGSQNTATTAAGVPTENAAGAAAGGGAAGSDQVYAMISKSAGNPNMEKMAEGFQEVCDKLGVKCVVKHPESATAEAQITMINELVAQGVSSIAVAGNDFDALQPALSAAAKAGIKVCSFDSSVNPDSRLVFINQASIDEIGQTLMDAILDISGGEGQWAILSATSQATNQNAWIEAMKKAMEGSEYAKLELVEIAYGDDEYQKSVDQTQALLQNYPNLKVICAPTTVGIMAAAKVLQDEGSTCKLTGLGLPSEMADYIGTDKACPYMYLWNPYDLGRLAAYVSIALVDGSITGAVGETFTAGDKGDYEIVAASDGGTEVIVGPPFRFDPDNIDEWKLVY